MALMNAGYRTHIQRLHPSLYEPILRIGTWVAVKNVFGCWQFGVVERYGISTDYAEGLRGVCRYGVRGLNSENFGYDEFLEDEMFVIPVGV